MRTFIAMCVLLTVLCVISWAPSVTGQGDACTDTSECPTDHCCTMGHYVGSGAACQAAPKENDSCRPGNVPTNSSTHDGKNKVLYTNVYDSVCPCSSGLICDPSSGGVCKKST